MKKIVDRIFGAPTFLSHLFTFAHVGTVLPLFAAFAFVWWSRNDGPLGCLALAMGLVESALVTLSLSLSIRVLVAFLRKGGFRL